MFSRKRIFGFKCKCCRRLLTRFAWDQGVPTLVGETSVAFDSLTLSVPEDSWFSISDVSGGESFSIVGQVHLSLTVTPSNREEMSRNVFGDALPPTISAPPPPLPSVPKPHLEESEEASAAPHPATVHTLFPEKLPTYAWDVHKKPTKPAKPVKPAKPAKPLPPTPKRPLPPVHQRTHAEQMAKPSPPTKPAKPMKPLPALPPKVSKPLPSLPAHRELPQPPAKVQTEDPAESMKPEEVTEPIEPAHELAAEPKIERELEAIQSELEKQPTVEVEKEEIAEETA